MHGCIHSVELLEMALDAARSQGYTVREDKLDGSTGGCCTVKGRKWLFLDPSLAARERLAVVIDALAVDKATLTSQFPPPLAQALRFARSNTAGTCKADPEELNAQAHGDRSDDSV